MAIDIAFIAFFFIGSLTIFLSIKWLSGGSALLNSDNFILTLCYLYSMPGILILFFQIDNFHREFLNINDKSIVFEMLLLNIVSIFSIFFGIFFTRKLINLKFSYSNYEEIVDLTTRQSIKVLLFGLLSFVVLVLYLNRVNSIALLQLIKNGTLNTVLNRSEMTNSFDGKYFLYAAFFQELGFFLLMLSFVRYLCFKRGRIFFLILLCMQVFTSLMAIQKGPILNLIIYMYMTYILVIKSGKISGWQIIKFLVMVLLLATLIFSLFIEFESPSSAMAAVVMRAFAGSISPGYFYLQFYPDINPFLFGRSIPNPADIFPYVHSNYSFEVFDFMFPLKLNDAVGSAPTAIWGEAYANFGYIGIPFVGIFFGIYYSVVTSFMSSFRSTPITSAFYTYSMYHFSICATTGFSYFFYDLFLWIIIAVVVILNWRSGKFYIKA